MPGGGGMTPCGMPGSGLVLTIAPFCGMGQLFTPFLGWSGVELGSACKMSSPDLTWSLAALCVPTPCIYAHGSANFRSPGIGASAGRALSRDRTPCSLEELHFLDYSCAFVGFLRDHGGGARAWAQRARQALGLLPGRGRQPALSRTGGLGVLWGRLPRVVPGRTAPQCSGG